ncbi:MAG: Omp28-related outer membrane protein [Salibacteraceae bacterium]
MKNIILIAVVLSIAILACDKVEDPFEGIAEDGGELIGDTTWSDTTHLFRKMFTEEFTGHTCANCPKNSEKLNSWSENEYKDQMVVVAIHYGSFAEPQPAKGLPLDWRVEAGKDIHDLFNANSYPTAVINRLQAGPLGPGQWQSELQNISSTINSPTLKLDIRNIRNESENKNVILFRGEALQDLTGDHLLGVLVIEDSLIAPQIDDRRPWIGLSDVDTFYVHRHMIRGSIGPTSGNPFITGSLAKGERVENSFQYEPTEDQNPKHLIFVGFVRDISSGEVIQVEEIHAVESH